MSQKSGLYTFKDILGVILSEWRTRAVIPHIIPNELMDLACGDNRLVRKLGFGVGVDITPYKNVNIVHNDFTHLPFEDKKFNTVTILAALNYFEKPIEVLKDIKRVLKDDGNLIITFLDKKVSAWFHSFWEKDETPRPAFNEEELVKYLDSAGLEIYKRSYFMFGVNCIYSIRKKI